MKKLWKMSLPVILAICILEAALFIPSYSRLNPTFFPSLLQAVKQRFPVYQQASTPTEPDVTDPVAVYRGTERIGGFASVREAIAFAKQIPDGTGVKLSASEKILWDTDTAANNSAKAITDAPHYFQLPELPRGCEVTSLAMLLAFNDVPVDKMQLAQEIAKDTTPLRYDSERKMWWGNPHKGFVGDMMDLGKTGFGVFHEPIEALARKYAGDHVVDLTGLDFQDVLAIVRKGYPVWVIVTITFTYDPYRQTEWMTSDGLIVTASNEHSVLLTGSDGTYVYFNDPLQAGGKNRKKSIASFEEAWRFMGKQAMTIVK